MLLQNFIELYSKANLEVFEIRGDRAINKEDLKKPVVKNWQKLIEEPNLPRGNLQTATAAAVVLPDHILIIDVDPRNFKDFNSFEKLKADLKLPTSRFIIKTQGGGEHHYYLKDPKVKFKNIMSGYPGVEFKSRGRYVIIPGSVFGDKSYELISGSSPGDLGEINDIFYNQVDRTFSRKIECDIEFSDDPADIKNIKTILKKSDGAIEGQHGDEYTFTICTLGLDYGVSPDTFWPLLLDWNKKCVPEWPEDELYQKMQNAYTYGQNKDSPKAIKNKTRNYQPKDLDPDWYAGLKRTEKGGIAKTLSNILIFFRNCEELKNKLAFNEFSRQKVWVSSPPWKLEGGEEFLPDGIMISDRDFVGVKVLLSEKYDFEVSTGIIEEAFIEITSETFINPVKDYFNTLPIWDGVKRLERLMPDYCGTEDNAYTQQLALVIFNGIVSRVFKPGCVFDYLPIFIGEQGMGKSYLIEVLSINKNNWYLADLPDLTDPKNIVSSTKNKLIIEWQELSLFNKKEAEEIKKFISTTSDTAREAFRREAADYKRRFIVIATNNKCHFLNDDTGARRMLPVHFNSKVDIDRVKRDLLQLYAEALHNFKNKKVIKFDDEAMVYLKQLRNDAFLSDDLEDDIKDWIDKEGAIAVIMPNDILLHALKQGVEEIKIKNVKIGRRIASIMRRLGYNYQNVRVNGKIVKGYVKI